MLTRLTRRSVLQGMSAAAVAPYLRWLPGGDSFNFAFFSDTHVGLKSNIAENRAMLAEIAKRSPDFAINGGDVTDYGWVSEYKNYHELVAKLPFRIYNTVGNHDVRWSPLGPKAFREGTGDPLYSSFNHKGVHLAVLDSTVPLSHWGHFEREQLRWLERDLAHVGRDKPVFVVTHHWVGRDRVMVDNEAALLKVIEPYNVKVILNGHGHSDLLWTWNGIPNTMNKGLYQNSYSWIEVDQAKGVTRLSRRSGNTEEAALLFETPLRPSRDKRRVWALAASVAIGDRVQLAAKEARWGDGPWLPVPDGGLAIKDLAPGSASLSTRDDEQTYFHVGETVVAGDGGVLRKRWDRAMTGGVMSHVRLDGGVLFISAMDGSLTALRASDGHSLWVAKTEGYCHSSPTMTPTAVIVGSADGHVYAFDRSTGKRLWRTLTGGPVYASAAVAKGLVIIGSGDGLVYGLDLASGAERWRYELPRTETSFVQSPAATDGERVYLGAWDKHLYCLDAASGKLAWRQDCVGERSFAYSPAIGGPCLGDGRVYVPANGNLLWAFDAVSGDKIWSVSSPGDKFGYSGPTFDRDRIFIGCLGDNGEARCVDAATGKILWTAETGSVIYDSSPAVASGVVTVGSVSGLLSAFDADSGRTVGRYSLPTGHFLSSPVMENKSIYVATYSDHCLAFDVYL